MASTPSNSMIALRNERFYSKKLKSTKKKSGLKIKIQKNVAARSNKSNGHEQLNNQFDGQEGHQSQEEFNDRDDFEIREQFDGQGGLQTRGQFEYMGEMHGVELENRDRNSTNDIGDNDENHDTAYRRGEKKRREKERKRYKGLKNDMVAKNETQEEFDGREGHRNQEQCDDRDDSEVREQFDGHDDLQNREQFEDIGEKHGVELENRDRNSTNDIGDNDENHDTAYRRGEKKRREKERKRYKGLKNDMAAINAKMDPLIRDFKAIKKVIKRYDYRPQPSSDEDIEDFNELPRLPLTKKKHVKLMEGNATNNRAYLKQLITKMRTIGGANIKKNVISIFKELLSTQLRTRICWKGSQRKRKMAFKDFPKILDAIRQAVKFRHKNCTEDDIAYECKLRFKQAEKDYARELAKQI